jgi:hypothetical protein
MNEFKLVSELLVSQEPQVQPNYDMIISKPYLFHYVLNDDVDKIQNGIPDPEGKGISTFFTRVPHIPKFSKFLSTHTPVKISITKLEKSKDGHKIIGYKVSKSGDIELTPEMIQKLMNYDHLIFKAFERSNSFDDVPQAILKFQSGLLPSFAYKVLDPVGTIKNNIEKVRSGNYNDEENKIEPGSEKIATYDQLKNQQPIPESVVNEGKIAEIVSYAKDMLHYFKSPDKEIMPHKVKKILDSKNSIIKSVNKTPYTKQINNLSKMAERINPKKLKGHTYLNKAIGTAALLKSLINNTNPKTELLKIGEKINSIHVDDESSITSTIAMFILQYIIMSIYGISYISLFFFLLFCLIASFRNQDEY